MSAELTAALAYASAGVHVFPARVTIVNGRKVVSPIASWREASTTDPAVIASWFGESGQWRDASLCIDCGRSGIVVVDLDRNGSADGVAAWAALVREHALTVTPVRVRTPSGGEHWYYRCNGRVVGNTQSKIAPGIDTRGLGGFVLAWPSRDIRGGYGRIDLAALATAPEVPGAVADWVNAKPAEEPRPASAWNAPSTELALIRPPGRAFTPTQAFEFYDPPYQRFRAMRTPEDHGFNGALNALACVWSHFVPAFMTAEQAEAWLFEAATHNRSVEWQGEAAVRATIRSGLSQRSAPWRAELAEERPAAIIGEIVETATGAPAPIGLNLPEEFWAARPELTHIRQAAHSRGRSGDVALFAVLARLAALWPHEIRLDTGVASPASANLFVAVVGPSSAGKSTSVSVARSLVPLPSWCREGGKFADSYPLGTGEGIAESFMGWDYVPARKVPDKDGNMVQPLNREGGPKMERVRMQVRHNALFYMDEGEALGKMLERTGATVGETLRRGWSGGTLGQANGRAETTRIIDEGTYSIGLVIGFQPGTCQLLLADAAAGTPQRFLWTWATDPAIPGDRVAHPGALRAFWPEPPTDGWLVGHRAPGQPVTFAGSIRERLWVDTVARGHGEVAVSEMDGHQPLALVKVSALLAQLDGRRNVTEDDWALACMVWATSCRVRDWAIAYGRWLAGKAAAVSRTAYAEREGAAESSRLAVRASAESAAVERVARRVATRIHERGATSLRDVRHDVASRDRQHLGAALDRAAELGWIKVNGTELAPGGSVPVGQ